MNNQKALDLAKDAIAELDLEIEAHEKGQGTVSDIIQLNKFRNYFWQIHSEISSGKTTTTNFGIARSVVDTWPFSSQLGELLITAERAYLKLES